MTIIGSNVLAGASGQAAGGYAIERSLRFNSSDSAYLSRTPASAGNRKTWTWAGWVKRSGLSSFQDIWGNGDASALNGFLFRFDDGNKLDLYDISGSVQWRKVTTQVFRDASAWYHFVISYNTANATAADRVRIYVNGVRIDSFSSSSDPSLNYDGYINNTNSHSIGRTGAYNGLYLNGYLADIHFIDGQALDPTSFGEFDDNGIWQPIEYTGSYGTNGFHLDFADNASTTTIGYDAAGSNDWTANNLSVTAGAGNDSVIDVPTNGAETDTGVGGEVRGNYATLNPLALGGSLANGNLDFTSSGSGGSTSTVGVSSGKWYWEVYIGSTPNNTYVGLYDNPNNLLDGYAITGTSGNRFTTAGGTFTVTSGTFQVGDIFGVAADIDAGIVTWYRNGSVAVTLTGATLNTKPWFPGTNVNAAASSPIIYNFGQRPFAYTAPSGFKALNTANLPAPLVTKPSTVFDTKLYTGNGSTQTISGLGFSPDLVWIKARAEATFHVLVDSVRSTGSNGSLLELYSNGTNAEGDIANRVTSLTSDGFTLGSDANTGVNKNNITHVAWTWDAGSSTVTNTQGSISSQVRANASAGFSVITYPGNGSSGATIGHGLGAVPQLLLFKNRSSSADWFIYHQALGNTTVLLFTTSAQITGRGDFLNSTTPSSTLITLGNTLAVNNNSNNYVCYAFAPVSGYSSFGSYVGNGSSDGVFVYTGMRPRYVLFKRTSSTGFWMIYDAARSTYNAVVNDLNADTSDAESAGGGPVDFLSNGFKLRNTSIYWNASGSTYIYAAFAEHPFQYARAR
jgi:hypothetical protein